MREVKEADVKSGGRAELTAQANLVTRDSRGKAKSSRKTIERKTRNAVGTASG